jgi:hypothetical protein
MTSSSSRRFLADRSDDCNASASCGYRPAEPLRFPLLCLSASSPITECRSRTPSFVSCQIPLKATQARTWIMLK